MRTGVASTNSMHLATGLSTTTELAADLLCPAYCLAALLCPGQAPGHLLFSTEMILCTHGPGLGVLGKVFKEGVRARVLESIPFNLENASVNH